MNGKFFGRPFGLMAGLVTVAALGSTPNTTEELAPPFRIEANGKERISAEGKLEDIGSYHRTIKGTWTQGTAKGDFKLTRD